MTYRCVGCEKKLSREKGEVDPETDYHYLCVECRKKGV